MLKNTQCLLVNECLNFIHSVSILEISLKIFTFEWKDLNTQKVAHLMCMHIFYTLLHFFVYFIFFFYLFQMCGCFSFMYVCVPHSCGIHRNQKWVTHPLELGRPTDSCEHCGYTGNENIYCSQLLYFKQNILVFFAVDK